MSKAIMFRQEWRLVALLFFAVIGGPLFGLFGPLWLLLIMNLAYLVLNLFEMTRHQDKEIVPLVAWSFLLFAPMWIAYFIRLALK